MVAYKKLSDVNNGGSGSIFEVFEYTTDGTPYGKPKISSGYAIIKSPGELLYRTTNNQDDVNGRNYADRLTNIIDNIFSSRSSCWTSE